jgi:hypothetical protein
MPSPQTPLPERARGFENLQLFLAPLLLLWEKGLGDEGKRFVSQSGFTQKSEHSQKEFHLHPANAIACDDNGLNSERMF